MYSFIVMKFGVLALICFYVGVVSALENWEEDVLIEPIIGHDEEENHILTVSVHIGDYNRVVDTKKHEIILGLRNDVDPPINKVICNFLGEILNISPKQVDVIEGHSENAGKTVQIDGSAITSKEIVQRIMKALRMSILEEQDLKPSIKHRKIYNDDYKYLHKE